MNKNPIIEKDGKFRYSQKRCCGQKLIELYFILTKEKLLFYKDEKRTKLFLEIKRDYVLAINKRQIDKNDVFKFSIYWQNPNEDIIHEIKLKTESKASTDKWINDLRKLINPKRYEFKYDKENYIDANELYHFRDTKEFYLALCHLEYILLRNRMIDFFEYYKGRGNNINNNSSMFNYENDTERLKGNDINLDINEISPKLD